MGKHLTPQDIEDIVHLLDGWSGKLTWPELCKACKPAIGTIPTRQTLMKFSRVATAYALRKGTAGVTNEELPGKPSLSAAVYTKRFLRLQHENLRLTQENQQLLQQFIIWQYNAYSHGLSNIELDRPIPER